MKNLLKILFLIVLLQFVFSSEKIHRDNTLLFSLYKEVAPFEINNEQTRTDNSEFNKFLTKNNVIKIEPWLKSATEKDFENSKKYKFIKLDIKDKRIKNILFRYKPSGIFNLAAETHVDRSIDNPDSFIQSNIVGVYNLLESFKHFSKKNKSKLIHISTDEVYGDILSGRSSESYPYKPSSPYAASKAASDHLVSSYVRTYKIPAIVTNCSNNYGPYQFPEKLIPLTIQNALTQTSLSIYGDGLQIRDWLYVSDHCSAIRKVLEHGIIGEVYNIGGLNEKTNIEIAHVLCDILDELRPLSSNSIIKSYRDLIVFVKDRPGHDRRYAINATKIETELKWRPKETFDSGIRKTVEWYLNNTKWIDQVISGEYRKWIKGQYS